MVLSEFAMKRNWGPVPNFPRVIGYKRQSSDFISIAGPCSVESEDQIFSIAKFVSSQGATHLRGGVFRAGTYPGQSFGIISIDLISAYHAAARAYKLKNIIEVLDYTHGSLKTLNSLCDCFQVGARSMQNYTLLRKIGQLGKPVFIKRGPGSTLDEWLGAAEHVLTAQQEAGLFGDVHLIERGSSTFENHTRWTLSVSMIAAAKSLTSIPIIVDASHGSGRRDLVGSLTLAGVAAGADGCLIETHPNPEQSISDADQAIGFEEYAKIMSLVKKIRGVLS